MKDEPGTRRARGDLHGTRLRPRHRPTSHSSSSSSWSSSSSSSSSPSSSSSSSLRPPRSAKKASSAPAETMVRPSGAVPLARPIPSQRRTVRSLDLRLTCGIADAIPFHGNCLIIAPPRSARSRRATRPREVTPIGFSLVSGGYAPQRLESAQRPNAACDRECRPAKPRSVRCRGGSRRKGSRRIWISVLTATRQGGSDSAQHVVLDGLGRLRAPPPTTGTDHDASPILSVVVRVRSFSVIKKSSGCPPSVRRLVRGRTFQAARVETGDRGVRPSAWRRRTPAAPSSRATPSRDSTRHVPHAPQKRCVRRAME